MSEMRLPAERSTSVAYRARLGDELALLRPSRRRLPRRISVTIGTLGVAGLTMGAGAAYLASAPAPDKSLVHCYNAASVSSDALGTDTNYPPGSTDPVAACAGLWQIGSVRAGVFQAQSPQPPGVAPLAVPQLVACTLHGVAAVFPGPSSTCQHLGLPVYVPDASNVRRPVHDGSMSVSGNAPS